ncbi:MAG: RNA-guided pseudouridylation complex pseudouridine synthase subunit Cbf5 [Desulfurococcales archaeon]|nr:RNA-guided pseudouridylation complex pseudouridine synthase subunit Cbf5 [Desulfurococcales archaeon]
MTRVISIVAHSTKEYICVMQLHAPVERERLEKVLREFQGLIYQRPPLRSSVRRSLRKKRINKITLLEYNGKYALLHVDCEAGTYMRKLCWDVGLVLGVGAHMRELRRVRTGPFTEEKNLVTLQMLSEAIYRWKIEGEEDLIRNYIMPGEVMTCSLPKIALRDTAVESIVHGATLAVPGISKVQGGIKRGDTVALMTLKGELVAIGKALMSTEEMLENDKGEAVKPERVIMQPGTYPKAWKKRAPKP